MSRKVRIGLLVRAALIAGVYAAATASLGELGYGPVQVRISEALTVLPYLDPAAGTLGVVLGVFVANLLGPYGLVDVLLGTLLTLLAALLTARMPRPWLAPLPPVVVNALGVPLYLQFLVGVPYWPTVGTVFLGQLVACYGIGYPLLLALQARPEILGLPSRRPQ
ncbi:MAG: QueT transporter family protein [Armatimonadetes bacterium]|nr:QueT transporter family protein [Armatimonadota bacterium]MDW8152913.1 QueT transporter family protein [Armatimonadota bacterium]